MLPPRPRRHTHHLIWVPGNGIRVVNISCAHCPHVSKVLDLSQTYEQDLLDRQIQSSRDGHANTCTIPVH